MLEKIDLDRKTGKKEYKEAMKALEPRLGLLQRRCKAAGIPVILVFEGMGGQERDSDQPSDSVPGSERL